MQWIATPSGDLLNLDRFDGVRIYANATGATVYAYRTEQDGSETQTPIADGLDADDAAAMLDALRASLRAPWLRLDASSRAYGRQEWGQGPAGAV